MLLNLAYFQLSAAIILSVNFEKRQNWWSCFANLLDIYLSVAVIVWLRLIVPSQCLVCFLRSATAILFYLFFCFSSYTECLMLGRFNKLNNNTMRQWKCLDCESVFFFQHTINSETSLLKLTEMGLGFCSTNTGFLCLMALLQTINIISVPSNRAKISHTSQLANRRCLTDMK